MHLQEGVPEIARLLRSWGLDRVDLSNGWGCSLPMEKRWCPRQIDATQLGASWAEGQRPCGGVDAPGEKRIRAHRVRYRRSNGGEWHPGDASKPAGIGVIGTASHYF